MKVFLIQVLERVWGMVFWPRIIIDCPSGGDPGLFEVTFYQVFWAPKWFEIVGNGNQNVSIGSALLENASGVPFNNGNCCGQFGMENCHTDASLVPTFEGFLNSLYALSYGSFEFTATITARSIRSV